MTMEMVLEITPELRQRLRDLSVYPDGHAFDVRTGRGYSLNGTGLELLRMLQKGVAGEDAVESLVRRSGQQHVVVRAGVLHFFQQLRGSLK